MQQIIFTDWGIIEYGKAWTQQEELLQKNIQLKLQNNSQIPPIELATEHHLIFCEHPHVYTLGKSGAIAHLLLSEEKLKEIGATFYKTNRGGDITYHGKGQIVGYPILDLEKIFTDLGRYMRALEEVIIRTLAHFNLKANRLEGSTGVWLDVENPLKARKICAMGVRCSRWITIHGFALNVNTDLSYFNHIVPCGIIDKGVTSIQKELGEIIDENKVKTILKNEFEIVFDAKLI